MSARAAAIVGGPVPRAIWEFEMLIEEAKLAGVDVDDVLKRARERPDDPRTLLKRAITASRLGA